MSELKPCPFCESTRPTEDRLRRERDEANALLDEVGRAKRETKDRLDTGSPLAYALDELGRDIDRILAKRKGK